VDERRLIQLAVRQHGLITRQQVLMAGGSDSAIRRQVEAGRWKRKRRGVFVAGAVRSTWQQGAMAAVLAAGDDALVSCRSAIRLWGLVERSGRLQLTIAGTRRVRLIGIEVHRTDHLPPADRAVVDGISVTSLARTLVDVSPLQSERTMGRWLDLGIRLHGLDLGTVASRANSLTRPGRILPRSLMAALSRRADGHDPGRSVFEARVIEALARRGLPAPLRQYEVERPGGSRAFIDLAYPQWRLAIELDGWETHGLRSAFDADRARGNDLVLLGYRLLRFTWSMSDDEICDAVAHAIGD